MKSNVIDIVLESKHVNMSSANLTEDIAVTISRDPSRFHDVSGSFYMKPHKMNSTTNSKDYTKFHCFTRRSNYTAMNFEMKPEDIGLHLNVSELIRDWGRRFRFSFQFVSTWSSLGQ